MGRVFAKASEAVEVKPADNDTLATIVAREPHAAEGITWQEVALFNWGTDAPAEVNEALRQTIGCESPNSEDPAQSKLTPSKGPASAGSIKVPKLLQQKDLKDKASVELKLSGPPKLEPQVRVELVRGAAPDKGKVIGGVKVKLTGPTPGEKPTVPETGLAIFDPVKPGSYTVSFTAETPEKDGLFKFPEEPMTVEVKGRWDPPVHLDAAPGSILKLKIKGGPDKAPMDGVKVKLSGPETREETTKGKEAVFKALTPGEYKVGVEVPGDSPVVIDDLETVTTLPYELLEKELEIKIKTFKVLSLGFKSDHDELLDNTADWRRTGNPYKKPEWTEALQSPVSHDLDKEVEIEIEVEVGPACAMPEKAHIIGDGFLKYDFEVELKPGKTKHTLKSTNKLPAQIKHHKNKSIRWKAALEKSGEVLGGETGSLAIYAIMHKPRSEGQPEDGATVKRMEKAIAWMGEANTLDAMDIVEHLFGKFDHYVLGFNFLTSSQQKYLDRNPAEKQKMIDDGFATFKNNSVGGAWPLAQYNNYGGECQAMVRCIRGVMTQAGCPGKAEVKYVNADASKPYTAIVSPGGTRCKGPDPKKRYALVDAEVKVGEMHGADSSVGWNNYEAYMRYEHEGDAGWFGGGIGRLPKGQDPLNVFFAIVEYERWSGSVEFKRMVTKVWKYSDHTWATWTH